MLQSEALAARDNKIDPRNRHIKVSPKANENDSLWRGV